MSNDSRNPDLRDEMISQIQSILSGYEVDDRVDSALIADAILHLIETRWTANEPDEDTA